MKLICKSNAIPEEKTMIGLGPFKREEVTREAIEIPFLTKGKMYEVLPYYQTSGYNYVSTQLCLTVFSDNQKWETFSFDSEVRFGMENMLNWLFEDPT